MLLAFRVTFEAMFQIFLLGLCGYILTKKKIISSESLKLLSRLLIGLFFPCFIFVKLIVNFSFSAFPNWWIFPLISVIIIIIGFIVGNLFVKIDNSLEKFKKEFISLVTFQNSGYLPLILIALLLPPARQGRMFIYLFLFLLGFNLVFWSMGVFYLVRERGRRLELGSLFSPPVISMLVTLFLIAIGLKKFIPNFFIGTAKMFGDCALPLAILVVGGNLSQTAIRAKENFRQIFDLVIAKLLFLPMLFLALIFLIKPPYEIAFLLLLEGAVPSATSLSIIMRNYDRKDNIISQGIFWTHLISLLTIPIFLSLFSMVKTILFK